MRAALHRGLALLFSAAAGASAFAADSNSLYGIHWWGNNYPNAPVDPGPIDMLNLPQQTAYDTEIVNTHNEFFWSADWVAPLYADLKTNKNVTPITRINYKWGETVPSPTNPDYANWKNNVVGVVNTLKSYGHLWQLGNECNLNGEANNWASNQINPAGYAQIYRDVHAAIASSGQVDASVGAHKLLLAPPSPGGVIAGVRNMDGNAWLSQTIDAFGANKNEIDGAALHSYGGTLTDFRRAIAEQVAVIDSKGLAGIPLYITEFNRFADPNAADPAAEEAVSAQFVRDAYKFLDRWNRTPGNHNIVTATWFVYDADQTAGGGWNGYSIEYWKTHGKPAGDPGDLYTAFSQTVDLNYKAGTAGTRPLPSGVQIIDNFEGGDGHFSWTPTQSGTTAGALSTSFKVTTADDSYSQGYGQKIGVFDDPNNSNGWYVRHVSGGGAVASNTAINLTSGTDGNIGFFLRVFTNSDPNQAMKCSLVLDSGTTGGGANSDMGVWRDIVADGEWHYYEWSLDSVGDWTAWRDINNAVIGGSDGVIPTTGQVSIDSIILRGGNANVEFFLDTVMLNRNGSLSAMLPVVPEPASAVLLAPILLALRRR